MAKTYTTVQGDMWDMIAKREMGSERFTHLLISANQAYRMYTTFSAGIQLTIPDVPKQVAESLPPWKR